MSMATTMTGADALGRAFLRDDQRRAAEAQRRAEEYAGLVLRAADGDLKGVASVDEELERLGRTREQLLHDVKRLEWNRRDRKHAAGVLEVLAEHRRAERDLSAAQRELAEGIERLKARVEAARQAEQRLRAERHGPVNNTDSVMRWVPERLASAFTRAERALREAEEREEAARLRGEGAKALAALEQEVTAARAAAAKALEAALAYDPPPHTKPIAARVFEAPGGRFEHMGVLFETSPAHAAAPRA